MYFLIRSTVLHSKIYYVMNKSIIHDDGRRLLFLSLRNNNLQIKHNPSITNISCNCPLFCHCAELFQNLNQIYFLFIDGTHSDVFAIFSVARKCLTSHNPITKTGTLIASNSLS